MPTNTPSQELITDHVDMLNRAIAKLRLNGADLAFYVLGLIDSITEASDRIYSDVEKIERVRAALAAHEQVRAERREELRAAARLL